MDEIHFLVVSADAALITDLAWHVHEEDRGYAMDVLEEHW